MQKIRYIVALVLVAHAFSLFAQSGKVKKAYNTAKQFLSQKNYELAMTYFDQVRKVKTKNPLAPNAHFYYAQCALLSNRLEDAKQNFELVLNQYPDFGGIDEIHYALADIAFQASADDQAIRHLQKIQATDFKKDIQGLKGHYAVKMNVMRLRLLNQIFPQDTLIAQCLVDKIAATSEKADELSLIEGLVSQMNLEAPKALKTPKKVFRKPRYKVAVIFPFDTERLKKGDTSAVSRLSIGLYQGMRTAQQELDTLEGTKLELYAYELKRDGEDALKKMLEEKEFDDIDIIIGPLFENLYKIVADFAAKRQIQVINPISIDNKLLINNFTYLYESTVETQAQKITEFVKKNFENPNTLIFYDNLSKNKNLATFYRQFAEKAGLKILAFEEIESGNMRKINALLEKYNKFEVGSILLSSTSQMIAEDVMKRLKADDFHVPVFAPDAWLRFQTIDYEDYEKLKVHFWHPEYLTTETAEAIRFKKTYHDLAHHEPNNYGFIGYEITHYFAGLLQINGTNTDFRKMLSQTKLERGKVADLFDYAAKNDNQFVPILKIKDGDVSVVNGQ